MFKKLATLVCATAIAAGAFTGVVANAAVASDMGVTLTGEKTADDKITVNVYADGYDAIMYAYLYFDVTGADVAGIDVVSAWNSGTVTNVNSTSNVSVVNDYIEDVTLTNGLIYTFTLTFADAIDQDVTITVANESNVGNADYSVDLNYYPDYDLETLGFNDLVISAGSSGGGETTVTVTPTIAEGNAKAYVDVDDPSDCAVVGKVDLEIDGGSYVFDRSKIKYTATGATEGVTPTAVTDLNDNPLDDEAVSSTIISATNVIVYVVINGTTDIAELSNVTFE